MKIKTNFNAKKFPDNGEINLMPSETVPDQSMTVTEILQRYSKGLPLGGKRVEIYEDEDLLGGVNPATLDLAEIQEIQEDFKQELKDLKGKYAKKPKSVEEHVQEEVEKQMKNQTGKNVDQSDAAT